MSLYEELVTLIKCENHIFWGENSYWQNEKSAYSSTPNHANKQRSKQIILPGAAVLTQRKPPQLALNNQNDKIKGKCYTSYRINIWTKELRYEDICKKYWTQMITCSRALDIGIPRSPGTGSDSAPLPRQGPAHS